MTDTLTTSAAGTHTLNPGLGTKTHNLKSSAAISVSVKSEKPNKARRSGRIKLAIYLLSFVALSGLFLEGYTFYTAPLAERPHHQDYRTLRPAGQRGLIYGAAGTAAMLLMHFYSLRKRSKKLAQVGSLRTWLDAHIYLGVIGPLLILLHTSFRVGGLVAISFWSMVGVALSGVLGRYLYQKIPRDLQGKQISLQELEQMREDAVRLLNDDLHAATESGSGVSDIPMDSVSEDSGIIAILTALIKIDLLRPWTRWRLRNAYMHSLSISKQQAGHLADLTLSVSALQRRVQFLDQLRQLFHYWHVLHKPLAFVMYMIMTVHIGVAIWTGYVPGF